MSTTHRETKDTNPGSEGRPPGSGSRTGGLTGYKGGWRSRPAGRLRRSGREAAPAIPKPILAGLRGLPGGDRGAGAQGGGAQRGAPTGGVRGGGGESSVDKVEYWRLKNVRRDRINGF